MANRKVNSMEKYEIWKTNIFNDDILTDCVGVMYDLELAKDFVDYQATVACERYAVTQNGEVVYNSIS